jgi:hypothetical protein
LAAGRSRSTTHAGDDGSGGRDAAALSDSAAAYWVFHKRCFDRRYLDLPDMEQMT